MRSQCPAIVCSALLISADTERVSSVIDSTVRCLVATRPAALRHLRHARISATGSSASTCACVKAARLRDTTFRVPTARSFDTNGNTSADAEPGRVRDVHVEKVGGAGGDVVDDHRLLRSDDRADGGALGLEDDLRPRAGAPFVVGDPRRVGLKLLAVFVEQREADAVAGHQPGDALGHRLKGERHVHRLREDLEHRVVHLQLLDFVARRAVRVLGLGQRRRQPLDAAARRERRGSA